MEDAPPVPRRRSWSLQQRLLVLPALFVLALALVLGTSAWLDTRVREDVFFARIRQELFEAHRSTLKTLVEVEARRLGHVLQGVAAKADQLATIERETDLARFFPDQSGYFFTYQFDGTRISVPVNKSLNGQNTLQAQDSNGKRFIEELITRAKEGGGFVEYVFEKPGAGPQPKLSYATRIPGTDYLVGTGVYTDDVDAELREIRAGVSGRLTRYRWILLGLATLTAVGTLGASVWLARRVARFVQRSVAGVDQVAREVETVAGQLAESSMSMAQGVNEQAASLEEAGASLEELSNATRRNSESTERVNEVGRQARTSAEQGSQDIEAMNSSMAAILASSQDIEKILHGIDEIAFQTNILALNAAVEAARAGDAGMGFAVVADEVRNLAQRSAQAAKETANRIGTAVSTTRQGVELSQRVSTRFEEIAQRTRQVDGLTESVTRASREQTTGIEQVNQVVAQINTVTQQSAAAAEECAAAAQELKRHSLHLKDAAADLRHLTG